MPRITIKRTLLQLALILVAFLCLVVLPDLRLMRGMRLRSPAAEPRATYPVPEPFERDADFPVCADAKEVGNVF